jgi:hypothetical protein
MAISPPRRGEVGIAAVAVRELDAADRGWPLKHSCNLCHVTVTRRSVHSWNPGGERPWQQIADLFEWIKRSPGATPIPSPADWGSRLSQPRARGSHLQSVQQTTALPKFRQVICGNPRYCRRRVCPRLRLLQSSRERRAGRPARSGSSWSGRRAYGLPVTASSARRFVSGLSFKPRESSPTAVWIKN